MITQEQKNEKEKSIERHIKNYMMLKQKLAGLNLSSSYKTKSQQKEVLETISRCFEELADADQTGLIIPMWEAEDAGDIKKYEELQKVYYNYASNPYQFTEKKQELVKDYCPHFNELLELRNLWLSVKFATVEPKPTKEDTKNRRYNALMNSIDYSRITDKTAWEVEIDNLIQQYNKVITPIYDKMTDNLIDMLVMIENAMERGISKEEFNKRMEELRKKHPSFNSMMSYISGKDVRDIAPMVESWKQEDLMDTKFKVSKALNFDIHSEKLESYGDTYKSWIINGNIRLRIETITAGGYNIQRLHNRTLVKVSKL